MKWCFPVTIGGSEISASAPLTGLTLSGNVTGSGNFSFGAPSTIQSSSAGDISLEIKNPATTNTTSTSTLKFIHYTTSGGKIVSVREGNYAAIPNANSALVFHTTSASIDTEKLRISSLGHITASGNITSSGKIFGSTSLSSSHANNNVVLVNTVTGELYHTGSYGSGGGGTTPTWIVTGKQIFFRLR